MGLAKNVKMVIALSLTLVATALSETTTYKWPQVAPLHATFNFPDAKQAEAKVHIRDIGGKPIYVLECHTGNYEGDTSFDYSGDFHCQLVSLLEGIPSTSLADNPFATRDWETRARFLAEELFGKCGDYPEYGLVRTFKLRGMKLTLGLSDVTFDQAHVRSKPPGEAGIRLRSFSFDARVESDETALSAIAEPVPYAEPLFPSLQNPEKLYRNCETVIPAHVLGVVTEDYLRREGLVPPYPQVMPLQETIAVSGKPYPTKFDFADKPILPDARVVYVPISSASGKTVYEFMCSAYNIPIGEGRIDRYGIVCGLFIPGKTLNLLGDAIDPYSRMTNAQILPDQLHGKCADYPDWGALRQFRLRGFKLTLQFKNPEFVQGEFFDHAIKRVDLDVKVEPDAEATAPVALPPKYAYWGFMDRRYACETVFVNPRVQNN